MRRQQIQIIGYTILGKLWQKQQQPSLEIQMKLNQKQESLLFSVLTRNKFKTKEYICQVKPVDFQAQCQKNGTQNLIDTCSQLFLLVKANNQQFKKTFEQIFHFNQQNQIEISVQVLNNIGKKKLIKFVFPTKEVNETNFLGIERLQSKIKQLEEQLTNLQEQLDQKKYFLAIERLQSQIKQLKEHLNNLQNQLDQKNQLQHYSQSLFQCVPSQIMLRNSMAINLKRINQFLVYKQPLYSDNQIKMQFKTRSKGVLKFKVFTYQNIEELKDGFNLEESDHTSTWVEIQIGDIVTATVNSKSYQILLERNEQEEVSIEGEGQIQPTFAYSRLRKIVEYKKLMRLQKSHFGIGLPFSAQIFILNVQKNRIP